MMHLAHAKNAYLVLSGAQHEYQSLVLAAPLFCMPDRKTVLYKICPVLRVIISSGKE